MSRELPLDKSWHSMDVEQVLTELSASAQGLTNEEAKARFEKFGPNEIRREGKISPFKIFINQFTNILIVILLIATFLSIVIGEAIDAIVILIIVIFCTLLGFVQEYRAEKALEALKKMVSPTTTVLREGKEIEVPTREVVPGDILLLREGDKISSDARLIEVISLQTNEAALTGESAPVSKELAIQPEDTIVADRSNMVFSGTTVTYGKGKSVVIATAMSTEFGKIAKEVTVSIEEVTPLERRTKEIGGWLGKLCLAAVVIIAGLTLTRHYLTVGSIDVSVVLKVVIFGVALAVAAVPESLPAVVTGTLAIGMRDMAKRHALVRKMPTVETLGCTTVICSDKTGTLTKGEMTVRTIYNNGKVIHVTGVGYEPKGDFHADGIIDFRGVPFSLLMKACILCGDAILERGETGEWYIKGDPTEGALVVVAAKAGFRQDEVRGQYPRIGEVPFSSERKRMSTIHLTPEGKRIVYVKGAPEVILDRSAYSLEEGKVEKLSEQQREEILKINTQMAGDALRVLGVAFREVVETTLTEDEERDLIFVGLLGMIDPPREDAIEAVKTCKQVKMKPIMITGDHKLTAVAIAREMGIHEEGDVALTGIELDHLSDEELGKIVDRVTVYARVSPFHKTRIVEAWKKRGQVVAMTGDGVNDAPALKHADIGIAMGTTGTEVTKEAASMVLMDDNFATIVHAIFRGRWIYDNIKKYLAYLLQCNIIEIVLLGGIVLVMGDLHFLPLLPAAILYINLATDGLPALAIGLSPPDPDLMQRPPRDPKETIFTIDVTSFFVRAVAIEFPILLAIFLLSLPAGIEIARTRLFLAFVAFELVVALNCRSLTKSIVTVKPHRLLYAVIVWELFLLTVLIAFVPQVLDAFGIVYPTPFDIGLAAFTAVLTMISIEITKSLVAKCMRHYAG